MTYREQSEYEEDEIAVGYEYSWSQEPVPCICGSRFHCFGERPMNFRFMQLRRHCDARGLVLRHHSRIDRQRNRRNKREKQECSGGPVAHEQQHDAPDRIVEKYSKSEQQLHRESDHGECEHSSEIERHHFQSARFSTPHKNREPCTEEECECRPGFGLDSHPYRPPDEIFRSCRRYLHRLVEMDEYHPEERDSSQDVERDDSIGISSRRFHAPPD
jgi:hypothetical protein